MRETVYKKLECLFAWKHFYSNSKMLEVPTLPNKQLADKVDKQIIKLEKQINN